MDYNFHTHTCRCGHASGEEADYVRCAIEGGIRHMGFSEHIPFQYADGYQQLGVRVPVEEALAYRDTVLALKEKYADQIDLHLGFETEYFPQYFPQMLENARKWGAEYLILGQHYVLPEHPKSPYSGKPTTDEAALARYADSLIAAMDTGVFTYIAHPDVYNFVGDDAIYQAQMRRVCAAARKKNIPLEINFYGIRDHRYYPNALFWEVAGEEKCPVTFGFDAHDPQSACDRSSLPAAMALVEKYGLNYIGMPKLVLI